MGKGSGRSATEKLMTTHAVWRDAFGDMKLPFLKGAGDIVDGKFDVPCPCCRTHTLRFYYHEFNHEKGTGTLWAWCPQCRLTMHIPRVSPKSRSFPDPYRALAMDEFAEMEGKDNRPFVAHLDDLWRKGVIGVPQPITRSPQEHRKADRS
jgi:hypothetical protein